MAGRYSNFVFSRPNLIGRFPSKAALPLSKNFVFGVSARGQAILTAVIFLLFVSIALVFGFSSLVLSEARLARGEEQSLRAYTAAEAGAEDLVYRIKNNLQYNVAESVLLDGINIPVTVVIDGSNRDVVSQGTADSRFRVVEVNLRAGAGASFHYGAQAGDGGIIMENTSMINGSVFANGHIVGNNSPGITGDAFAAGSSTVSNFTIGGSARGHRLSDNVIAGSATATEAIVRGSIGGHGYADRFSGGTVSGNAYYKSVVSATTTVNGQKILIPETPLELGKLPMPISERQLDAWENEAAAGGTTTPSSCPFKPANGTSIGPAKITCDVSIEGTAIVTLTGPLWVVGNFQMQNSAKLQLAPSFGDNSGVVIADRTAVDNITDRLTSSKVSVDNSAQVLGSGGPGSYIMLVSRNNSAESGGGEVAVDIGNSSTAAVYYAPHGEILIQNNVDLKEATAWRLHLKNSAVITYESGLANMEFSSGAAGGFEIQSWKETE